MAATEAPFPSVLPYVSWSSLTIAAIPADAWPLVFGSMQTLKGHVQEYPGCQKLEAFVHAEAEGAVRIHCYTTWDTPDQLEAFLRMLVDVAGITAQPTLLMEKIF
ncbi:MAG: hypothetical protein E6F93_08370 [Actinobacteria bacterium]|nr:MAG: hypothetical protein E6F93_08370 [Actinomycetota bacterium]